VRAGDHNNRQLRQHAAWANDEAMYHKYFGILLTNASLRATSAEIEELRVTADIERSLLPL
jgi:hypothetical protein